MGRSIAAVAAALAVERAAALLGQRRYSGVARAVGSARWLRPVGSDGGSGVGLGGGVGSGVGLGGGVIWGGGGDWRGSRLGSQRDERRARNGWRRAEARGLARAEARGLARAEAAGTVAEVGGPGCTREKAMEVRSNELVPEIRPPKGRESFTKPRASRPQKEAPNQNTS